MRMINKITVGVVASALLLTGCGASGGSASKGSANSKDIASNIKAVTDDQLKGTTINLARFFGDCDDTTKNVTDMSKATTECEAIQINAWSKSSRLCLPGIVIRTGQ